MYRGTKKSVIDIPLKVRFVKARIVVLAEHRRNLKIIGRVLEHWSTAYNRKFYWYNRHVPMQVLLIGHM